MLFNSKIKSLKILPIWLYQKVKGNKTRNKYTQKHYWPNKSARWDHISCWLGRKTSAHADLASKGRTLDTQVLLTFSLYSAFTATITWHPCPTVHKAPYCWPQRTAVVFGWRSKGHRPFVLTLTVLYIRPAALGYLWMMPLPCRYSRADTISAV